MKSRYFNFMLMKLKKHHFYWQADVKHLVGELLNMRTLGKQRREIWEQCKEFSKN